MVNKYVFGSPFETEAVVTAFDAAKLPECFEYGEISADNGFCYQYQMDEKDVIYGLGEANRGINKRGYLYVSDCTDDPNHTEEKTSLYGAHNFVIVSGKKHFGLFFDYPGKITFDVGYTRQDMLIVSCEQENLYLYVISGDSAYDVVKQFRKMIGTSYVAPKYAFGFGQSRWGYKTKDDIATVVKNYRDNHIPIDMVYLDIDYMQDFKDFTINPERFPDFPEFVQEMKDKKIHLIPIIDAGVKIEAGYDIYEEGVKNGYFCKREDGSDFVAAVWPGWTHFPDVLNPDARKWFGGKYEILTQMGIDGFWNDMNEPCIFYSEEGVREVNVEIADYVETFEAQNTTEPLRNNGSILPWAVRDKLDKLQNNPKDYTRFYHNVNGQKVRHDLVHNLFGFNMTRAAGEALKKIAPERKMLLFSRSSYIGMHRYGGIWTGDNHSWWSHILLNLKMMPSLNMCGFLYTGADLGGFGSNTTRDLLLRWLALGIFTPLMRNHTAIGTREQECYQFEHVEDFRHVVGVRYRLIPYLYSEYLKAAKRDEMYFRPLGFDYPEDTRAIETEDQLLLGNEAMIAPVYTQNASGRVVYLPEEMKFIKFMPDGSIFEEILGKGTHYIDVALNEIPLFIRKNCCIPVVDAAENVEAIDMETMKYIGFEGAVYELLEE